MYKIFSLWIAILSMILVGLMSERHASAVSYETIYSFTNGTDGEYPDAGVTVVGSKLYGTTTASYVGATGFGTVYSLNADGSGFQTIHAFNGDDGANPEDALTAIGSTLYGTTSGVTSGQGHNTDFGSVFSIGVDGTGYQTLQQFVGVGLYQPFSGVTSAGSNLYGTTSLGSGGYVYSVGPDGSNLDVAHSFSTVGGDGQFPVAGLTLVGSALYGVTRDGGANGDGALFTMNSDGSDYRLLYGFNISNGMHPLANLIQVGSELYGTASSGGSLGRGVAFSIGLDGSNFQVLRTFNDGGGTTSALTLVGSTLYGATSNEIFSMNLDGSNYQVIHQGSGSNGTLTLLGDTLYGTTTFGGPGNHGTIFAITVPEPSTVILAGLGGLALLAMRPRR